MFLEHGHAIAVSVRTFRVAGIKAIPDSDMVSIKTAVQVAVRLQMKGLEQQAEDIYRQILDENPDYPDALHLLGVVFYKRGDSTNALTYVEKAIQLKGNQSHEIYNTLGLCYRTLGKLREAEHQFIIALTIDPNTIVTKFNLAMVYQQQGRLTDALLLYSNINQITHENTQLLHISTRIESKIRQCDILGITQAYESSLICWQEALNWFPDNAIIAHELANILSQVIIILSSLLSFSIFFPSPVLTPPPLFCYLYNRLAVSKKHWSYINKQHNLENNLPM